MKRKQSVRRMYDEEFFDSTMDYSMSNVKGILDEDESIKDILNDQFINVWSVPIIERRESVDSETYLDDFFVDVNELK